jgi:2,3-bisphosphoglycerate-independent phosphoglycerate mutase
MTRGEGNKAANAAEAVQNAYNSGVTDEFIKPTVIVNGGVPVGTINDDDAIIFYNFRGDRAKELTRAFCEDDFRMFKREQLTNVNLVCFTDPDPAIENKQVAFEEQPVINSLGEYLSLCGRKQLRITESETAACVTSFFDGLYGDTYDDEDRLIIRSQKKVESYAEAPGMNAPAICERLVTEIGSGKYDFILCCMANADVVGHTGDMDAAIKACETLDKLVGRIYDAVLKAGGVLFISSTHGKAEQLKYPGSKKTFTGHTMNPVPIIMINYKDGVKLREIGCLADIAPTILDTMGLARPREMTGKSMLELSEKS